LPGVTFAGRGRPVAIDVRLAIIVPVLNEAGSIGRSLAELQPLRARGVRVVVVDGGSPDGTADIARPLAYDVIVAARGRARQMNAGAQHIGNAADVLLFLHADTRLPADADSRIAHAIARGARWGRFDVRIDGSAVLLRFVARLMNLRSRLTGICTGDQAIFVERALFESLGGFADQPLMEDVEFTRRARHIARPAALTGAITSGRRWEQRGVGPTILQMWSLRWRYWRGADPAALAREYRNVR
jgi:rSAM/selenodomain-associated transferase 2